MRCGLNRIRRNILTRQLGNHSVIPFTVYSESVTTIRWTVVSLVSQRNPTMTISIPSSLVKFMHLLQYLQTLDSRKQLRALTGPWSARVHYVVDRNAPGIVFAIADGNSKSSLGIDLAIVRACTVTEDELVVVAGRVFVGVWSIPISTETSMLATRRKVPVAGRTFDNETTQIEFCEVWAKCEFALFNVWVVDMLAWWKKEACVSLMKRTLKYFYWIT